MRSGILAMFARKRFSTNCGRLDRAVIVVRGNCDSNFEWPLVLDLARGGLKFRLQHVPPDRPPDDVDVLLHGHTHVPRNERRGRVLFLNPGCVTRPNRGAPPSVAWLEIADGKINWKLVPLSLPGNR